MSSSHHWRLILASHKLWNVILHKTRTVTCVSHHFRYKWIKMNLLKVCLNKTKDKNHYSKKKCASIMILASEHYFKTHLKNGEPLSSALVLRVWDELQAGRSPSSSACSVHLTSGVSALLLPLLLWQWARGTMKASGTVRKTLYLPILTYNTRTEWTHITT